MADLHQHRRARRRQARRRDELALLQTVAATANMSSALRAFRTTLEAVCRYTGWPVGHVYLARGRGRTRRLVSGGAWHVEPRRPLLDAFRKASEQTVFRPNQGLPGEAFDRGEAVWARGFDTQDCYPRHAAAMQAGLRTGLAFPVLVGRDVVAVLEFFTPEDLAPDPALLDLLAQVGDQLGRAAERERTQARLRDKNRKLRQLVAEAETQRQAAEAASRAKSAFLAVTSHEVRTPLNAVLGLAEGLRREPLSPNQAELVDGIVDAGAMLMRLLNAVLDLSSIESGQVRVVTEDFDLIALLRRIERVWRAKAQQLEVDFGVDVDGMEPGLRLRADPGKIEQSLINLISNALKFTPPGGAVAVRCAVGVSARGYDVELCVDDSGPGIPEADRARILQPYEQTEEGKGAGGAGLGLAICVGNMAALGGAVRVGVSPLGGARLTLRFPAAAGAAPAPTGAAAPVMPRRLRILAAEDNAANRRVLDVLLQPLADVDLVFAANGQEALDALSVGAFDLVLMDVNMPGMDGLAALSALRARGIATPVHMLTANALPGDHERYRAAGADGVLAKPIEVAALYQLLAACGEPALDAEPGLQRARG